MGFNLKLGTRPFLLLNKVISIKNKLAAIYIHYQFEVFCSFSPEIFSRIVEFLLAILLIYVERQYLQSCLSLLTKLHYYYKSDRRIRMICKRLRCARAMFRLDMLRLQDVPNWAVYDLNNQLNFFQFTNVWLGYDQYGTISIYSRCLTKI